MIIIEKNKNEFSKIVDIQTILEFLPIIDLENFKKLFQKSRNINNFIIPLIKDKNLQLDKNCSFEYYKNNDDHICVLGYFDEKLYKTYIMDSENSFVAASNFYLGVWEVDELSGKKKGFCYLYQGIGTIKYNKYMKNTLYIYKIYDEEVFKIYTLPNEEYEDVMRIIYMANVNFNNEKITIPLNVLQFTEFLQDYLPSNK